MQSINTNSGLTSALRNFETINYRLNQTGDRISTGLKVIGAKDDASNFAIAQGIRADIKTFDAVDESLSSAKGLLTVTIAGLTASGDQAGDIKKKIIELTNPANTATQQAILKADLIDLLNQSFTMRANSTYNGLNQLITGSTPVGFVSDVRGGTITVQNHGVGATFNPLQTAANSATTVAQFQALLPLWDAFAADIGNVLSDYGSTLKQVEGMQQQNAALKDALVSGLGATVDANMAKESALLQSQQAQQQLASQSFNVATSFIGVIRNLFA